MRKLIFLLLFCINSTLYAQDFLTAQLVITAIHVIKGQQKTPLELALESTQKSIDKKDIFDQIKKLNTLIGNYPDSSNYYAERGILKVEVGAVRDGHQDLKKAFSKDANHNLLYLYLGKSSYLVGNERSAIQYLNKYNQLYPDDFKGYLYLGYIHMYPLSKKKYIPSNKIAIQNFTTAISLNNKAKEAYMLRGFTNHMLKNYDLAIQDFNILQEFESENPKGYIYLMLGNSHFENGNNAEACKNYELAQLHKIKVKKRLLRKSCK